MKDNPTTSDLSLTKKVWKGIWSLQIPNRVKTLIWRAGSDALPTKVNLRKRRLLIDDSCPHCNLDKETSLHALQSCPSLNPIWKVHFGWLIKEAVNCTSLLDIIQLCQEKSNLSELFAMTASLIWSCQNQIRAGEVVVPVGRVSSMAVDNLQEFQQASSPPQRVSPIVSPSKWSPPPWLKVNFDGAIFSSLGSLQWAGYLIQLYILEFSLNLESIDSKYPSTLFWLKTNQRQLIVLHL